MNEETQVTLKLSINDLNIVMASIRKMPIEIALETFQYIQMQAEQQLGKPTQVPQGPLSGKIV